MLSNLRKKTTSTEDDSQIILKKGLLEALEKTLNGDFSKVEKGEFGCDEVECKWNQMVEVVCNFIKNNTFQINDILKSVTKMDIIKEMIERTDKQTEELHTMSSSSEELSSSIDEVAKMAEKVANDSNSAQKLSEDGLKSITNSIKFVKESFDEISEVNKNMENVKEKTNTINDIIDIVKGIADQTNLLALNAAIEAARAGEQGKGFSVVADEVRKLAENTKESVMDIEKNIRELQDSIQVSVNTINSTSNQLDAGQKLVDGVQESIYSINKAIDSVNETVIQVAANTEEQTAVTHTFAKGVMELSEHSDYLNNSSNEVGKSIYNLSKQIEGIREEVLKNSKFLSNSEMIDIYKTDHLRWRWVIYNMILGHENHENVDSNVAGDYKSCALGKWYYSDFCEEFRDDPNFLKLEEPHIGLHKSAQQAITHYKNGELSLAEQCLKQMDEYSVQVFEILDKVKEKF